MVSEVSADTQSALLLAASLGKRSAEGPLPLTLAEYRELVEALFAEGVRPRDLLGPDASAIASALVLRFPEKFRQRITGDRIGRLLDRGGKLALALSRWTSAGIWVASRADEHYPSRYKKKLGRSSPPIVFGVGPAALLDGGGLAVVGSRKPDESSEKYTMHVGKWAASAKIQIVSGAARGVDEGTMLSCITAGGTAIGVVAESLLTLSTRRNFREAILAGRLTLISSFDPDAGFTVPNAMARNRWIYALSDRALVVACSQGRGGTWAGAIEAIKHGEPVFVRIGNPERPGNEALLEHGALPAPDDLQKLWEVNLPSIPQTRKTQPEMLQLSPMPQQSDLYALVAPAILLILKVPMNAKQFAAQAGLTKSQADAWLKRLILEGRIEKIGTTYHLLAAETLRREQPSLF